MKGFRGPRYSAKCSFYVDPADPLSAADSIERCVSCVTSGNAALQHLCEDFRQTAFLTILEETPSYDPGHSSGASFITFMKSKVCCSLWKQREKELQYVPCPHDDDAAEAADTGDPNLLAARLRECACSGESLEDEVIQAIETDVFRECLPELLTRLTEKECTVVSLKYFHDARGREIASSLGISEGRVSQLLKSALAKLKKAYHSVEKAGF